MSGAARRSAVIYFLFNLAVIGWLVDGLGMGLPAAKVSALAAAVLGPALWLLQRCHARGGSLAGMWGRIALAYAALAAIIVLSAQLGAKGGAGDSGMGVFVVMALTVTVFAAAAFSAALFALWLGRRKWRTRSDSNARPFDS